MRKDSLKTKQARVSKFVRNCGNCGIKIEKKIANGYICKSCGGEYKGC